jgi:hypothetical protein
MNHTICSRYTADWNKIILDLIMFFSEKIPIFLKTALAAVKHLAEWLA